MYLKCFLSQPLVHISLVSIHYYFYFGTDGVESEGFPMFTIQSELGMVTVAGNLDYETKSEYNLNISATDGESVAYCSVSRTRDLK